MKRNNAAGYCACLVIMLLTLFSCATQEDAERRLQPPKPARSVRMDDIEKYAGEDPARAIHLIGMYSGTYGETGILNENNQEDGSRLTKLRSSAIDKLRENQRTAIQEKRWDAAASLSRSLAALGVNVEKTGREPEIMLQAAKDYLTAGKELEAFLAAVHSHGLSPLSAADALFFLEQAVKARQRRTAHFFLAVLDKAQGTVEVPAPLRTFAEGRDLTSEMIKGVATVVVDRGIKVERGRGMADRVLGSAFFVDAGGLLITNYHVIASEVDPTYKGYSRLYIRMGDSTSARIPAKVVGWDKTTDLAVIKAEITPDYVFSVVDRIVPNIGDTVLAIGSPGGLEKTVTSGIVSALGRRFLQIGDVIQIDAAVNHGNSGGPVIDTSGRLVGIVFAGVEQFEGLNFAVPAERLAAALPAMLRGGKAARPWLGLSLAQSREGAEIIYVAPLTPAAEQAVTEGVFITSLNGERITAPQGALIATLQDRLFSDEPGELVALETSDGKKHIIRTAERPATPLAEAAKTDSQERLATPLFGLVLLPAGGSSWTPQYLVKRVVRGSVADEAGLSPQDPVRIHGLRLQEKEGYALLDIDVKKRSSGYMEAQMRLPALLDSPDTL
ncbi:MAG: S1C family serine protease [Spirochaetaceae bacterium]|nr:S1C family serine protease [Spirochaetaceae bacterium]